MFRKNIFLPSAQKREIRYVNAGQADAVAPDNLMSRGFTLIELSIVLVIIGLIVGGVLVGRDLVRAAAVRAQVSQIEKYQQAVNTFRDKYGYLPGDFKDPDATRFGFSPRGSLPGQGDGNGYLEGVEFGANYPTFQLTGENAMLWVDLSKARLIDGGFSAASSTVDLGGAAINETTTPKLPAYFPQAKIGAPNYVYVFSGGRNVYTASDNQNYFGLGAIPSSSGTMEVAAGLTVRQAYDMDKKVDDGLPQSGRVMAMLVWDHAVYWALGGGSYNDDAPGTATPASNTSCFDNGNVYLAPLAYSIQYQNGNNMNCSLTFKFQ